MSPVSGEEVRKDRPEDVLDFTLRLATGTRFMIVSPLSLKEGRTWAQQLEILTQQGFSRVIDTAGKPQLINDILASDEQRRHPVQRPQFLDAPDRSPRRRT